MIDKTVIENCLAGNKKSLEQLVTSIQGVAFNLSLRFLWNRQDAEDATQEILIKLITNLSKFDGRSKFETWAYRVAANYLLNLRKTKLEKKFTSFDVFADDLKSNFHPIEYKAADSDLLEKEMKTGCTLAMLQCLTRDLRIAFIFGSTLKIKSNMASAILNISPENFRKRLEHSRKLIGAFLNTHCGVYNPTNNCRCNKRINSAILCGRIVTANLNFANKVELYNDEMEELNSMAGIYQNHGRFRIETNLVAQLNIIIASKRIINDN